MRILLALLLLFPFAVATTAHAEDAETAPAEESVQEEEAKEEVDPSVTYSPDHCEFAITFPDEPYSSRRCEDPEKTKCYDVVSYTQVHEMSSTVNFRVICNPVDEKLYDDFSAKVMQTTLRAMTQNTVVEEYNSSFREEDGYKQAGLVGQGTSGRQNMIYIAQLWIGKQSAFSVEAELIGHANANIDKLFGDIVKSAKYTGIKDVPEPKKTRQPNQD